MDRFSRTHLQRRVRKLAFTVRAARDIQSVDYRKRFDLAAELLDTVNTILSPLDCDDIAYVNAIGLINMAYVTGRA